MLAAIVALALLLRLPGFNESVWVPMTWLAGRAVRLYRAVG